PKDYKVQAPPGIKITEDGQIIVAHATGPKGATHAVPAHAAKKEVPMSAKNSKHLLGELYPDKEYLEIFLTDKDFEHNPNNGIMNLVKGCLHYLETRTEFWRQQKPIYARKKERSPAKERVISARNRALIEEKGVEHKAREAQAVLDAQNPKAGGGVKSRGKSSDYKRNRFTAEAEKYVNASMNVVTLSMEKGDHQRALQAARSLLTRLTGDINNLPNREKNISDVTSMIGNIYMDLGCLPQAMQFYRKDLQHCKAKDLPECISRALGNMGRICVKLRRFDDAIAAFEKKLLVPVVTAPAPPTVVSPPEDDTTTTTIPSAPSSASTAPVTVAPSLERAWLYHDIGRCHLEMGRDEKAKAMGIAGLKVAQQLKDQRWCLNALVLIGQVEGDFLMVLQHLF
ncbi:Tetratricopeptide repeat protein 25, partial [Rhizoclosmatium hyalinum]